MDQIRFRLGFTVLEQWKINIICSAEHTLWCCLFLFTQFVHCCSVAEEMFPKANLIFMYFNHYIWHKLIILTTNPHRKVTTSTNLRGMLCSFAACWGFISCTSPIHRKNIFKGSVLHLFSANQSTSHLFPQYFSSWFFVCLFVWAQIP